MKDRISELYYALNRAMEAGVTVELTPEPYGPRVMVVARYRGRLNPTAGRWADSMLDAASMIDRSVQAAKDRDYKEEA